MRFIRQAWILGIALALMMGLATAVAVYAQAPPPAVKVLVDGQPVVFDVPPVIASGRVLVPLRGVFQRLGASVFWDSGTQTVTAGRGDTIIILRIGNTQAQINGQTTLMDVPAMLVHGRTMVPLRFISQALGSEVSWDEPSATVQITSPAASALPPSQTYPPAPQPQPAPVISTVTGTVVAVAAAAGQIQVQVDKSVYTYKVASVTSVSRFNVADNRGGSVALDALRPGDEVQVTVDQSGTAQTVRATFKEVSGKVLATTDAGVVVLENGDTYRLNRSAQIAQGGTAVTPSALRPGDEVRMRVNPQTNEIWAVTIATAAAPLSGITSVTAAPSGRNLNVGDVLEVVASGSREGHATFSIGTLRSGIPMVESTSERGTYYGSYTVQPGDRVQGAEVVVRLIAPDGQVFTASAQNRVQINAVLPAPATVVAPMIVSPTEGASIGSPFTVRGRAAPGSRVKITADYNGMVLLFKVDGSLGNQIVTADQSGNWSVEFTEKPPVYGLTVIITAAGVADDGRVISPVAKVTTTLS
ncbi:MAG TPA: copper amine oxidase N-terminal domain-containing protein [bacterium]|nr:copper amine oxidase N-terminal domain-containing protein [bacterium]